MYIFVYECFETACRETLFLKLVTLTLGVLGITVQKRTRATHVCNTVITLCRVFHVSYNRTRFLQHSRTRDIHVVGILGCHKCYSWIKP